MHDTDHHTGSNAGTTDQDRFQDPQFDEIRLPDGGRELMLHVPMVEGRLVVSDTYFDDVGVVR